MWNVDVIIDIVVKEKGKEYINAIGGKELYSQSNFDKNNIQLFFLNTLAVYQYTIIYISCVILNI